MRRPRVIALAVTALALLVAGCGDDDGAAVRETGESSGSGSGSGSHASASGSGSHASASGSAASDECHVVGGTSDAADREVHVELDEFSISPDPQTIAAGAITFETANAGEEPHELAIVRADDPSQLPLGEHGEVDDEAIEEDLVGEVEPFAGGAECTATFDLSPGTYVLLCNIVEEHGGEQESHFAEGMATTFTVS